MERYIQALRFDIDVLKQKCKEGYRDTQVEVDREKELKFLKEQLMDEKRYRDQMSEQIYELKTQLDYSKREIQELKHNADMRKVERKNRNLNTKRLKTSTQSSYRPTKSRKSRKYSVPASSIQKATFDTDPNTTTRSSYKKSKSPVTLTSNRTKFKTLS